MSCESFGVCVLASDCLEKQKKILRQLEEKHTSSETEDAKLVNKNTGEILVIPSPDDQHTDKNIVVEHVNYWQIKNGESFLRQESYKSCVCILLLQTTFI